MTTLVPAADRGAIEQLDPAQREVAVTAYLAHARDQLALAVELTGPAAVAALKAEIATAAEATKQLGLSKEIQSDAQEMVRRAEYALGKAIRAGQEAGEIGSRGQHAFMGNQHTGGLHPVEMKSKPSASDFFPEGDSARTAVLDMVDTANDAEFEAALSDARAEGNLSRANVVRKIQGVKTDGLTPAEKLTRLRELAASGHTSDQIAREIGVTESYVRDRAREQSIEIPADRMVARSKRFDHTRYVAKTVEQIEFLATGLDAFDASQVDWAEHENWVASLTDSMRALNRFVNTVKRGQPSE